ncbi:MAG: hypothetical protein JEZ07_18770 [Phycisphaerae bacterium]|nr:hypothetical protein [Phycisphaerae bacterium]
MWATKWNFKFETISPSVNKLTAATRRVAIAGRCHPVYLLSFSGCGHPAKIEIILQISNWQSIRCAHENFKQHEQNKFHPSYLAYFKISLPQATPP